MPSNSILPRGSDVCRQQCRFTKYRLMHNVDVDRTPRKGRKVRLVDQRGVRTEEADKAGVAVFHTRYTGEERRASERSLGYVGRPRRCFGPHAGQPSPTSSVWQVPAASPSISIRPGAICWAWKKPTGSFREPA